MRSFGVVRYACSISATYAVLAGCGALQQAQDDPQMPIGVPGTIPQSAAPQRIAADSNNPIQHVVVLVQEGRSFNDLFATTKVGCMLVGHGRHARRKTVHLKEVGLADRAVLPTDYAAYRLAYNNGTMCGFNLEAYQYVNPSQIQPYRTAAADYALADHMFQTQGSGDFTAHQDLIRGGTELSTSASLIDTPSETAVWGCPASPGTVTTIITTKGEYKYDAGPFPCTDDFPSSGVNYKTLADLLDAKSISWKYYTPSATPRGVGSLWNAFLVIYSLYSNKTAWDEHIASPPGTIFHDISRGSLPQMSWLIPEVNNSDHAGYKSDAGPAWVAHVVNAIGQSAYWNSTAVIVVWDDWGGFYDPVPPPFIDHQGGAGFRVPMLVISPYVPQGEVSHTVYGFGSIVRFIEDTWSLGRLGTTDKTSTSIKEMFDFNQSPRQFTKI